eukprot:gene10847-11002_t
MEDASEDPDYFHVIFEDAPGEPVKGSALEAPATSGSACDTDKLLLADCWVQLAALLSQGVTGCLTSCLAAANSIRSSGSNDGSSSSEVLEAAVGAAVYLLDLYSNVDQPQHHPCWEYEVPGELQEAQLLAHANCLQPFVAQLLPLISKLQQQLAALQLSHLTAGLQAALHLHSNLQGAAGDDGSSSMTTSIAVQLLVALSVDPDTAADDADSLRYGLGYLLQAGGEWVGVMDGQLLAVDMLGRQMFTQGHRLLVVGYQQAQVWSVNVTDMTVCDRLPLLLPAGPEACEASGIIIAACWLPGSETWLAITTPGGVYLYDVTHSCDQPAASGPQGVLAAKMSLPAAAAAAAEGHQQGLGVGIVEQCHNMNSFLSLSGDISRVGSADAAARALLRSPGDPEHRLEAPAVNSGMKLTVKIASGRMGLCHLDLFGQYTEEVQARLEQQQQQQEHELAWVLLYLVIFQ